MIIMPRKKGESVVLGEDIVLTVIEIKGDKVRLGVEHPRNVSVHRLEVYEENRIAPVWAEHPEETDEPPWGPADN